MLSTLRNWTHGSKKTLVQKYTDDLSHITSQIHELDGKLKRSQVSMDNLQSQLTYYGSGLIISLFAFLYWEYNGNWFVVFTGFVIGVFVTALSKWSAYKVYQWIRERQSLKLGKLRAVHQEKLEKLKEETNYHATNSIIQRFSQGEDQSEDAMLLMDEELKSKYEELNVLKDELAQFRQNDSLKDKQERDKWFDKVINALAGGDNINGMSRPIVCNKCKRQTGAYRMGNRPLQFVCPFCGWSINENEGSHQPTIGKDSGTKSTSVKHDKSGKKGSH